MKRSKYSKSLHNWPIAIGQTSKQKEKEKEYCTILAPITLRYHMPTFRFDSSLSRRRAILYLCLFGLCLAAPIAAEAKNGLGQLSCVSEAAAAKSNANARGGRLSFGGAL